MLPVDILAHTSNSNFHCPYTLHNETGITLHLKVETAVSLELTSSVVMGLKL